MAFYPIEDGTLGAASPKVIGVDIIPRYTSIQNLKEIRQGMGQLERTQEYDAVAASTLLNPHRHTPGGYN